MSFPATVSQKGISTILIKTLSKGADGKIPATLSYEKQHNIMEFMGRVSNNDNQFKDVVIYGYYSCDFIFTIDSIQGNNISEGIKEILSASISQFQDQIEFPKKKLSIGDSFTNEIPMSIPVAGMNPIQLMIKAEYTLKQIEGNIATFDFSHSVNLDGGQENMTMKAEGSGLGTMKYDLTTRYIKSSSSKLPMKMEMSMPNEVTMMINMETSTEFSVSIEQ